MTEKRQKDVELDPMLWQLFKNHYLVELVELNALLFTGYAHSVYSYIFCEVIPLKPFSPLQTGRWGRRQTQLRCKLHSGVHNKLLRQLLPSGTSNTVCIHMLHIWYSTYLCYSWHIYLSNQLVDELVILFEHDIPDTHRIILGQCIEQFAKAHLKGLNSTAKVYLFLCISFMLIISSLSSWTMCGCIISCLCKSPMPITRATFVP